MEQRVLVVENEEIVALDLEMCLQTMGYSVAVATTGEEAMATASRVKPDIVLMDILLGGSIDGVEVAEWIRDHLDIPLIFLTAYADPKTVERAAAVNPSGYLVKPFNELGLAASIQLALHRRTSKAREALQLAALHEPARSILLIGKLRIDTVLHRVYRGESELQLTNKEFRILQCLAEQPGLPFSPEALLTRIWGPQFSHYVKALRIHLGHLRQKIQGDPPPGVAIETIRGVGYRLIEKD